MSIGTFILITLLIVLLIFGGGALIGIMVMKKSRDKDKSSEDGWEIDRNKKR